MRFYETDLNDGVLAELLRLSRDWEAEDSCRGYRANERADLEGMRIFLAEEDGVPVGYLFGKLCRAERMSSVMPAGTPYFEVEELYVLPARRSQGIGGERFRHAEEQLRTEADFILLSTATKNWRAILHFYIDELGMDFWNARLYKPLRQTEQGLDACMVLK